MKVLAIVASCAVLASASVLAQTTPAAGKDAAPAGADASTGLAPSAMGKPTKTVGGATRSVKKNPPADDQAKTKTDGKSGDAKQDAPVAPRK
ncbi:MAG: hypothetical protein HZB40_03215 [Rhodocyclales bacterium]|nr:hypothetical protein [Rhodocyclales bacterium]